MAPDLRHLGRFDQSFFVRMVASFLLFTFAVAVIELGFRFGVLWYDFHHTDRDQAELTAERVANDVRSIMLNRGGPVASRTVYPILARTFEQAGLRVAIEPSPVTTASIVKLFGFEPRGIPPDWPQGTHHEGRVDLRADEPCLQCHVDAGVGDVLGTVTVRDFLSGRLEGWWKDVRLTGTLNLIKIVIHSVILFFLLRRLLEPLWSLRAAVAELAKGGAGVSTRAQVRSSDEFGELAHDLNAFLDRVNHILSDLNGTAGKMVTVNARLAQVTGRTRAQVEKVQAALAAAWGGTDAGPERLAAHLPRLAHETHELQHLLEEIGFLESQLNDVADGGRALLDRLLGPDAPAASPQVAPIGTGRAAGAAR